MVECPYVPLLPIQNAVLHFSLSKLRTIAIYIFYGLQINKTFCFYDTYTFLCVTTCHIIGLKAIHSELQVLSYILPFDLNFSFTFNKEQVYNFQH